MLQAGYIVHHLLQLCVSVWSDAESNNFQMRSQCALLEGSTRGEPSSVQSHAPGGIKRISVRPGKAAVRDPSSLSSWTIRATLSTKLMLVILSETTTP